MTQTIEEQTAAAWGDYGGSAAWAPVVDALKRLDTGIAAALRVNEHAMAQLRTCEWEMSGYPHPGCAEFGPPDVFTCGSTATHRAVYRDPSEGCEFPGDEHPDIAVTLACSEHVGDLVSDDDDPFADLLYIETIETGERLVDRTAAHRPIVYSEEQHCDDCSQPVVYDDTAAEFVHAEAAS